MALRRSLFFAAATSSAILLRKNPDGEGEGEALAAGSFPTAEVLDTPTGVDEEPTDVVCDDPEGKIPVSTKQTFSAMMGCNRVDGTGEEEAPFALCAPYGKGGCDNEACHDKCNSFYHSHNDYEKCRCAHWPDAAKFKDFSKGAPCPLKVQPRCYGGNLYRSECEALNANANISAADLKVVPQTAWDKEDLATTVKEGSSECQ